MSFGGYVYLNIIQKNGQFLTRFGKPAGLLGKEVTLSYVSGLPDPSSLNDPELVVVFKNLLKRDAITREKALQSLAVLVKRENFCVDEAFHWAWVLIYPKLSIDVSSSVRAQSHSIQGAVSRILGKASMKYMRDSIAPWLAGQYDIDRSVVHAAKLSLEHVFDTARKRDSLYTVFHYELMKFIMTVLVTESESTLSDTRFVSKDQAEAKYCRVVRSVLCLARKIIEVVHKPGAETPELISDKALWKLTYSSDVAVSKAALSLISEIIHKQPQWLDGLEPEISRHMISSGLKSASGSVSVDLLQVLIKLTKRYPTIWTLQTSRKSTPIQKLCDFISQGSRRAGRYFWLSLLALLSQLPESESPYNGHHVREFTTAFENGVKKESSDPTDAWGSYLTVVKRVLPGSTPEKERVVSSAVQASFSVLAVDPINYENLYSTVGNAYLQLAAEYSETFYLLLTSIIGEIDQDNDRIKLQRLVRLLTVKSESNAHVFAAILNQLTVKYSQLLDESRYSFDLECLVSVFLFLRSFTIETWQHLQALMDRLPTLLHLDPTLSPQIQNLLKVLAQRVDASHLKQFQYCLANCLTSTLENSNDLFFFGVLEDYKIYKSLDGPLVLDESSDYVLKLKDSLTPWAHVNAAILAHSVFISDEVSAVLLQSVCDQLRDSSETETWLSRLLTIINSDPKFAIQEITSSTQNKELLSFLWRIAESSLSAAQILSKLEQGSGKPINFTSSLIGGLLDNIPEMTLEEIEDMVVRLTKQLDESNQKTEYFNGILKASLPKWDRTMSSISSWSLLESLGISNRLEGGLFLFPVYQDHAVNNLLSEVLPLSFFMVRFFCHSVAHWNVLSDDVLIPNLASLCRVTQFWFASTRFLSIDDTLIGDLENSAAEFVNCILKLYDAATLDNIHKGYDSGSRLFMSLWNSLDSFTTLSYLSASACSQIIDRIFSVSKSQEQFVENRNKLFGKETIKELAFYKGTQSGALSVKAFDRIRNQLASKFINVPPSVVEKSGLRYLLALNILLNQPVDDYKSASYVPFPLSRLGMIVKSLLDWTVSENAYNSDHAGLRTEITKFLTCIVRLYDELPPTILDSCCDLVTENLGIEGSKSLRFYNMRLLNSLRRINSELFDENKSTIYGELNDYVLSEPSLKSDGYLDIQLNYELLRVMSSCSAADLENPDRLYSYLSLGMVASQIAYNILESYVRDSHDDRVIAFELKKSKLSDEDDGSNGSLFPEELLQSVQTPPKDKSSRYGYLLAWKIIFIFFENTTFNLRRAYIQKLSQAGYFAHLVQELGALIVSGSLDELAKKHDFLSYSTPKVRNPTDDEINTLALHVYYLSLRYTGSAVKTWFLNFKGRGGSMAIKRLTQAHVSPPLIEDQLSALEELLKSSDGLISDDFTVRIIRVTKEVRAFFTVDDQTMEISIHIPPLYPLEDLQVHGDRRIGVKERQWRAWILASQAISTTQNGAIIDILELFKRNVTLHFDGIEECAICYSILHQDHTLPSKTCMTCKKRFHADCLYKWFKSAGNNTCPLCRSSFSFRVIN